ncbi:type IV toxin-antitoxin system AbiEi family antitoxin [Cellvibrio sp. OA-2007]|uniref:type IV toxin-antitoxin system AbiEi family antitoxin n=1 Tax=Cellvibrio sp. OA-2007 TaxID=529823 RepID=UPI0007812E40|nr:type IV toxin-antitoxin system AbiEi family antitoxin [Cellvibrio sp. OA-2007]
MTIQISNKLNSLTHQLPEGLLVDAAWLEKEGYSRALRHQYVAANWLEQPARSVFRRPRGQLSWEQVVISLQMLLKYPISVGGRTALELGGYAHYLQQTQQHIHLYSDNKCPTWLLKLPLAETFVIHNRTHFLPQSKIALESLSIDDSISLEKAVMPAGLMVMPSSHWNLPLIISTPERAYLELLDELPQHESFHMADMVMEGLTNLSPLRLQSLLEATNSIKVKRLFFVFAERHNHAWLKRLDINKIDLGKGKRTLVKGGKFHTKYQITIPKEFAAESVNGIY